MFNGAVAYIRANPKATLGLTTIVVVAAQVIALLLSLWPFAFNGDLAQSLDGDDPSTGAMVSWIASSLGSSLTTALSTILLSGLLTVVIGRSIFGAGITIGEAWRRLRPRLWALIAFTVLQALGALLLIGVVVGIIVGHQLHHGPCSEIHNSYRKPSAQEDHEEQPNHAGRLLPCCDQQGIQPAAEGLRLLCLLVDLAEHLIAVSDLRLGKIDVEL